MTTVSKFGAAKLLDSAHAGLDGQARVNAEMFTAMEILGRKLERSESERDRLARRLALIESAATLDEKTGKLYLPAVVDPAQLPRREALSGSRWMVTSSLASSTLALFALWLALFHAPVPALTVEQIAALESLKAAPRVAFVEPAGKGWKHLETEGLEASATLPDITALTTQDNLAEKPKPVEEPPVAAVSAAPSPPVAAVPAAPSPPVVAVKEAEAVEKEVLIPGEDKLVEVAPVKKKTVAPVAANSANPAPNAALPAKLAQLEKRALQGIPEAQHDMATLYAAGKIVAQDYKRAIDWFTKAADGGIANAHYNLGVIYQQGLGVKPEMPKALSYYEKAAELGHPEAMYNLGIAYIEGIGTKVNIEKGTSYFKRAAHAGVSQAAFNLGVLYESNFVGAIDIDKAMEWYQAAADAGHAEARQAVARLTGPATINQALALEDTVEPAAGEEVGEGDSSPVEEEGVAAPRFRRDIVFKLQQELIRQGLLSGTADGVMTPQTEDAIRAVQKKMGLSQSGEASAALLDRVLAAAE